MTVSTNPSVANGYTDLSGIQVAAGATGVAGVTPGGGIVDADGVIRTPGSITSKRVVVIGDSILAQGATIENYDPTVLDTTVGQYSYRARGFVNALNVLLGMAFDVVYWGGITGQTVSQIAAREATVFDRQFDVVIENGGTNDVSLFATEHGGSLTTCENAVVASRVARWANATSYGAKLIIALDCLPVGSSSTYTSAQKQCLLRINNRLAEAARSYPAVRWVSGSAAITDPTSATGLVRSGTLHDNDRHPSAYGAWLIAKEAMRDTVIASMKVQRPVLSSALDCIQSDTSSKNVLDISTGLVTGSTGAAAGTGMSGTVVQRLTGSRQSGTGATIVASIVSAPNGIGNAQRFAISSAVAGDQVRALILPAITVTEVPKGTWGYFECMVTVSSGVNLHTVCATAGVQYVGGSLGGALSSSMMSFSASETGGAIAAETLFLRSPPVLFPADATSLTFIKGEIFFLFGGAGGCTADMYCMRWVKL
jgi:lysophospholipase L1-like esterase